MAYSDFLTIDEIREHCRVYHNEDDKQLEIYANAAITLLESNLNRKLLKKGEAEPVPNPEYLCAFNDSIKAAALLLISDLYDNRSSNLDVNTFENRTFVLLTSPFRNLSVRMA